MASTCSTALTSSRKSELSRTAQCVSAGVPATGEGRRAPALQDDRLDVPEVRRELREVVGGHVGVVPLPALPDAHAAGERAARGELDLPGREAPGPADVEQPREEVLHDGAASARALGTGQR